MQLAIINASPGGRSMDHIASVSSPRESGQLTPSFEIDVIAFISIYQAPGGLESVGKGRDVDCQKKLVEV
jgi:hypothetical protein